MPQGSVLSPPGVMIHKHSPDVHRYADDTQLYVAVDPVELSATNLEQNISTAFDQIVTNNFINHKSNFIKHTMKVLN